LLQHSDTMQHSDTLQHSATLQHSTTPTAGVAAGTMPQQELQ